MTFLAKGIITDQLRDERYKIRTDIILLMLRAYSFLLSIEMRFQEMEKFSNGYQ